MATLECIDDWAGTSTSPPPGGPGLSRVPGAWAASIFERLRDHDPAVLSVHCYFDVGLPWVRLVREAPAYWSPDDAVALGQLLQDAIGSGTVYLASLQPRALNYVLDPDRPTDASASSRADGAAPASRSPSPPLSAARYGAPLSEIGHAWAPPPASAPAPARRGRPHSI